MSFISDKKVQNRLCEEEQEGGVILFAETVVIAEQHHLDK